MITHSPSSVFHLHRVPDPQRWGNQQSGLSQRLWWAPAPLLQTLAPILCFGLSGLPAARGVTGKARLRLWRAGAGTSYLNGSSRVFHRTALPCLSADIPKCVYKDVFWQMVMWELCLSACCSCKRTVRVQLPCVCSNWRARDVFSGLGCGRSEGSYLKSVGLVRRRASKSTNSEKKKKKWHGDECYFQRAVMNSVYWTALGSDSRKSSQTTITEPHYGLVIFI